jgi:DNA-binding CsgD family transcriptional regulator/PAS domain-containing protein
MAPAALRAEDALRAAYIWHEAPDLAGFPGRVLEGLSRLVEADAVGWNEFDPQTGKLEVLVVPDEGLSRDVSVLETWAHQHPLIGRIVENPMSEPIAISDFCTRREFHRLDLYCEFFKPHEIEYQCSFGLSTTSFIGIAFNRSKRDFTKDERRFLDLLRKHIAQAHATVCARVEARERLLLLEQALGNAGREIVVLDRAGRISHASPRARRLLRGRDLAALQRLELATEEGRVTVRRVDADPTVLLVDLDRTPPPIDSGRAATYGLTPREVEILALVALGYTSAQIAAAMTISARTVDKHVEHALAKIGASSRREAVAALLESP